jgi:uncharacterized protein (DUF362 family)
MPKLSRRRFLRGIVATGSALAVGRWLPHPAEARQGRALLAAIPTNRVVHVHDSSATTGDYSSGWYGDYVDQSVVNTMTERGMMALTGASTLADAWSAILPSYTAGQKVAIKINLNNAVCNDSDNIIDALPQPVNAVIRGLKAMGVLESNICVYDVTDGWHAGRMPARLASKITALYPGVQFDPAAGNCSPTLSYSATEKVHFNVPASKPAITDRPICNALVNATYLINMPIMKKHGMAGVTLAFKNHFGSLQHCYDVHWSIELSNTNYVSTYSGLIDIYNNTHFKNKTVLTIGDGLYGARINNYSEVPSGWSTFGNQSPNSLFFSKDPVAIDCVMYDFLNAEGGVPAKSDDYLKLASASPNLLGTFEHWDAGQAYHSIDYQRLEPLNLLPRAYLPLVGR